MLCPKCARETGLVSNADKCPHCGAQMTMAMPNTPSPETTDKIITWDDQGSILTRLFNTWRESMFHPTRFFNQMPTKAGIGKPLIYILILGFIGIVFGASWQLLYNALHIPFLSMEIEKIPFLRNFPLHLLLGAWVIVSPLFIVIMTFVMTGIYHLCLMVLGGNKKGFEATFRSFVYAGASPSLFNILPFCGAYVGGIWFIVLVIIGFRETHRISTGKAVLAYFIPLILCICLTCGLAVLAAILIPAFLTSR
ncbi:MAG: YIP1 family protein [Planctomycetes bacterium]|nr:YIP1 family protein [Planctomycetota bacterium]